MILFLIIRSGSSSSTSSPSKGKEDEQPEQEVPEEKPQVPDPPTGSTGFFKPPSQLFKLARRLSQKSTVSEPAQTTKAAQEAIAMPPPEVPKTPQLKIPPEIDQESHASSYASLESPSGEPAEEESKKRRRWASVTPTPSGTEDEMGPASLDLQSHDPRQESVAMAQWAQGLGAPTASTADMEQPVLTRPLTLTTNEKVMEAGQLIDSTFHSSMRLMRHIKIRSSRSQGINFLLGKTDVGLLKS